MERLIEESYDGEVVGYRYDLYGNHLDRVDKNGKEMYTYNVKNQLVSRKPAKAETFFKYDQQGNVL